MTADREPESVLAEALHELHMNHGRSENRKQDRHDADDLLLSLTRRGWHLVRSEPARCPSCDSGKREHRGFAAGDDPAFRCEDPWHALSRAATPEPPALNVERLVQAVTNASNEKHWGIYRQGLGGPIIWTDRRDAARDIAREYDRLSRSALSLPAQPTPGEGESEKPRDARDEARLRALGVWDEHGTGR